MNSEVARLRAQIDSEYEAARLGLVGLASVARHEFATKRTENLAVLYRDLHNLVGDEGMQELAENDDQGGARRPGACSDRRPVARDGLVCD